MHEPHAIMLTFERDFINRMTWYVQHVLSYGTNLNLSYFPTFLNSSEAVLALVSAITFRFRKAVRNQPHLLRKPVLIGQCYLGQIQRKIPIAIGLRE